MIPFHLDYSLILGLVVCVGFFAGGARMNERSPLLWGSLSFGLWIVGSQLVVGGLIGGVLSQILLFAGLTAWEFVREQRVARRRDSAR